MTSPKVTLQRALSSLGALAEIERIIAQKTTSEAPLLQEISTYLLRLGGKRVRPVLTLLTARALGLPEPWEENNTGRQLLDVAAGIELIHMATLLHDDIIDKSPLRRHKESPFIRYGYDPTLLTGDFLLVRAFGLCARLDRFIIDATEAACIALTEGEISETPLYAERHDLASSLEIARKKTASLFKLACLSAAHLAGLDTGEIESAGTFGEKMGIAFQIVDDILDVTSTEDLLGKKTGQDLHERKPSIINVLWLAGGSSQAKGLLERPDEHESAFVAAALNELQTSEVIQQAQALALSYGDQAKQALRVLIPHDNSTVRDLTALMDYVLSRVQ